MPWVEARDAAQYPAIDKRAPHNKETSSTQHQQCYDWEIALTLHSILSSSSLQQLSCCNGGTAGGNFHVTDVEAENSDIAAEWQSQDVNLGCQTSKGNGTQVSSLQEAKFILKKNLRNTAQVKEPLALTQIHSPSQNEAQLGHILSAFFSACVNAQSSGPVVWLVSTSMKCLCIFCNFPFLPYSLSSKSFYGGTCRQTLFLSNYLIFHSLDTITPLLMDICIVSSFGLFEPHDMVVGSRRFGVTETWN